ncbi:MAG: hypothetical protein ABNG96_06400 [Flavobacterium sp.]|jgi:hypothetical protein
MKGIIHFRISILSCILFLILSTHVSHSQNVINIDTCEPDNKHKQTIVSVINSQEIMNFNNKSELNNNRFFIAEVNYSNINRINATNANNIRYIIIKISDDITSLNLNYLNQFSSLEIVHFIVEKPINESTLENMFNNSNNNWVITYQIEIPQ